MKHVLLIWMIFFAGCSSPEIFVYEKIPEFVECYSLKDHFEIEICNMEQQIILSDQITKVIEKDNQKKNSK